MLTGATKVQFSQMLEIPQCAVCVLFLVAVVWTLPPTHCLRAVQQSSTVLLLEVTKVSSIQPLKGTFSLWLKPVSLKVFSLICL